MRALSGSYGSCSKIAEAEAAVFVNEKKWLVPHMKCPCLWVGEGGWHVCLRRMMMHRAVVEQGCGWLDFSL